MPKVSTAVAMIRPAASKSSTGSRLATAASAPADDLLHHLLGRVLLGALAAQRDPDVVDHHAGALVGQAQGDGPSDAPAGSGDHCDSSLKQAHRATVREPRSGP